MGTVEQEIARHYGRGDLERVVLDGVKAAGHSLEDLRPEDLAPVDEFHIGGRRGHGRPRGTPRPGAGQARARHRLRHRRPGPVLRQPPRLPRVSAST